MEVKREQLNILLHAMKEIVSSPRCPEWVSVKLNNAVKEAKEYKENKEVYCDLYIGMKVNSTTVGDTCTYLIDSESDPVQGVRLFNLKIISSKAKDPIGYIISNVPETMIKHCEVE